MSFLASIRKGKQQKPPRIVVHGPEGVGKSTFAAGAPDPIFIQTEDGLGEIDCQSGPLATCYEDVRGALFELRTQDHEFKTVVIDSLDWLERLVWDQLCQDYGVKTIEKVDGGYGKGYRYAVKYWEEILQSLDHLNNQKGMVVILIAHTGLEKVEDPESQPYHRYAPNLHKLATDVVVEWSDAVLFANQKKRTTTEDVGFKKTRTIATAIGKAGGDRVLRCIGGPACRAKNRYGLVDDLELSWAAFEAAVYPQ